MGHLVFLSSNKNPCIFNLSARPGVLNDRRYPKISIQFLKVTVLVDRATKRVDDSERRLHKGALYVWLN